MGIQENQRLLHWNYFLALEADIEHLSRYVEFSRHNFGTFSIQIAHILLASSSEVDVVAKQLCRRIDSNSNALNIGHYRETIKPEIPELENITISLPRYGLELTPWEKWQEDKTPLWWKSYNKVKHQRDEHYREANLKNVLNAMSGLFSLILYFYRDIIEGRSIEPPPSIFTSPPSIASVCPTFSGRMALFYAE